MVVYRSPARGLVTYNELRLLHGGTLIGFPLSIEIMYKTWALLQSWPAVLLNYTRQNPSNLYANAVYRV
jgi:hypothetical protein